MKKQTKLNLSIVATIVSVLVLLATLLACVPFKKTQVDALDPYQASIKAKQALVERTRHNARDLSILQQELQKQRFDQILVEYSSDDPQREIELNKIGYYTYKNEQNQVESLSAGGDVSLSNVQIYYNSTLNQWTLTGYGNWVNNTWEAPSVWFTSVGKRIEVGGMDGLGITFSNTSGSSVGLALVSGYGAFLNASPTTSQDINYNSDPRVTSVNGAFYQVQDYAVVTKAGLFSYQAYYTAWYFQPHLVYNGAFANYSGNAVMVYSHTWDKSSINSIGIGSSGINIGWTDTSKAWFVKSNDTIF